MIDFNPFYARLAASPLAHWLETLPAQLATWRKENHHGSFPRWEKSVEFLPELAVTDLNLKTAVAANTAEGISEGEQKRITHILKELMPWRKGPY
ncbi:MAG: DUF1698 domain-containing protein, partial [Plesiomonas shigelloides]